jgi:hypothetical protein
VLLEVPSASLPSGHTWWDRRFGGDHLGARRVGSAVDDPEALADALGEGSLSASHTVADLEEAKTEGTVQRPRT